VPGDPGTVFASFFALGHRKGQGHADDEHKKRLHEIPEAQSGPRVMIELGADSVEERPAEPGVPEVFIKKRALPDEEEHREPAEEIQGHQPSRGRQEGDNRVFHGLTSDEFLLLTWERRARS
jgi:hypothetical protein